MISNEIVVVLWLIWVKDEEESIHDHIGWEEYYVERSDEANLFIGVCEMVNYFFWTD